MEQSEKIPLFPLGVVLLPQMELPLHIFEERYKLMISECLENNSPFGIVFFDGESIHSVGCTATITEVTETYDDGRMNIITEGRDRFEIQEILEGKAYMEAVVSYFRDEDEISRDNLSDSLDRILQLLEVMPGMEFADDVARLFDTIHPENISFAVAGLEGFTPVERQRFLEMRNGADRLEKSIKALSKLVQRAHISLEIQKIIGGNGHPPEELIRDRDDPILDT
jgi:Lon protease-like protein